MLKMRNPVARKCNKVPTLLKRATQTLPGRHKVKMFPTKVKNFIQVQIGWYTHLGPA